MIRHALLLSGVCAALLVAILAGEMAVPEGASLSSDQTPRSATLAKGSGAPTNNRAGVVGGWVQKALARPLFAPGRRPPAPPEQRRTAAAAFVLPRLTGVMVGPTDRTAIFAGAAGGKPLVTREGSRIGDDMIDMIEPGRVTVTGPEGSRVLLPSFDAAPRPVAAR
jgi:hypothetical protein